MRSLVLFAVLIAVLGVPHAYGDPWTDSEMRIMAYNIYHGGQDFGQVTGRNHEWLEVIRSRNPDVILIQEAKGWLPSDSNYVAAYVESLNVSFPDEPEYVGWVGDANWIFDLALITRLPISSAEMITSAWLDSAWFYPDKGFLHAELADSAGPVHVIDCHFKSGQNREFREKEARVLLQILDGIPADEPVWIGGDFNSYSPVDVEPGSPTPPAYDLGADSANVMGWEPIGYLLDSGYVDAFRTLHELDLGYTKNTRDFYPFPTHPIMRVDFVLHLPNAAWLLATAETVTDGLADVGSDHYPVVATYRRPTGTGVEEDPLLTEDGLLRCWPNPFASTTTIEYSIPETGPVILDVYSVIGRHVRSLVCDPEQAAPHRISWDGTDGAGNSLPDGWYYLRLRTGANVHTSRVLLLR